MGCSHSTQSIDKNIASVIEKRIQNENLLLTYVNDDEYINDIQYTLRLLSIHNLHFDGMDSFVNSLQRILYCINHYSELHIELVLLFIDDINNYLSEFTLFANTLDQLTNKIGFEYLISVKIRKICLYNSTFTDKIGKIIQEFRLKYSTHLIISNSNM